jgi:hypothetical protein
MKACSALPVFSRVLRDHLTRLQSLCSALFHRSLREAAAESLNHLLDFSRALSPFFKALEVDHGDFHAVAIDCLCELFRNCTSTVHLDAATVHFIFRRLLHLPTCRRRRPVDRVALAFFHSPCGELYCHGRLLCGVVRLLFRAFNHAPDHSLRSPALAALEEVIISLFAVYSDPPVVPDADSVAGLAANVSELLISNSLSISRSFMPLLESHCFGLSIRDDDLFVFLERMSKFISKPKYTAGTKPLATNIIAYAFRVSSPFFATAAFASCFDRSILPALSVLIASDDVRLARSTEMLLRIVWGKFWGAEAIVVGGLVAALASPQSGLVVKTLKVWILLVGDRRFVVWLHEKKMFRRFVTEVLKLGFPEGNGEETKIQKLAQAVIEKVLGALWQLVKADEGSQALKMQTVADGKQEGMGKFLFENCGLDPLAVGNFLAIERNHSIFATFLRCFDFKGKSFEDSFRLFFSRFQIPNDVKFLDRVLQSFAIKYHRENPSQFIAADVPYLLSFSIVVLLSHDCRMTFEEFWNFNNKIGEGVQLPRSTIATLYRNFVQKPIALRNSQLISRKVKLRANRSIATEMFAPIWSETLALLGSILLMTNSLPLGSLKLFFELASHCYLDEAVSAGIDMIRNVDGYRIQFLNFFLELSAEHYNFLNVVWPFVLTNLSEVERQKQLHLLNTELVANIFENSSFFELESTLDFVEALGRTALNELHESRFWSIQKLFHVIELNLNRPQIIWLTIWEKLRQLIFQMTKSSNNHVTVTGANLLRFVGTKFMPRNEDAEFHFHEQFMKSFLEVFQDQSSVRSKLIILESINDLLIESSANLKSGWLVVFQILSIATLDQQTQQLASLILSYLVRSSLNYVIPYLPDLMEVIPLFAKNANSPDAVLLFNTIAARINSPELWLWMFDALAKCTESSSSKVQSAAQSVFRGILPFANGKTDDVSQSIFVTILPKFYVYKAADFFSALIVSVEPNASIVRAIGIAIVYPNEELSHAAIGFLPKFRNVLGIVGVIEDVSRNILELSLENGLFFVRTISESFPKLTSCFEVISQVTQNNAIKADATKRNMICVAARKELNRCIRNSDSLREITPIFKRTLQLFLDSGYIQSAESTPGQDSSGTVCQSLAWMNEMNDSAFSSASIP